MKLLSKDLLREYGFVENKIKTSARIEVMSRNNIDIAIKDGTSFYHTKNGVEQSIKEIATLRKLYKSLTQEDLKPLK